MPLSNPGLAELVSNCLPAVKPLVESTFSSHGYPTIYDCCVLIVHCPVHRRFALCNSLYSGDRFRWFPYTYMSPLESWDKMRRRTLQLILGRKVGSEVVACTRCLNVFRLQLARTQRFVTRVIYYIRLSTDTVGKPVDICLEPAKIAPVYVEWCPLEDALKGSITNAWGSELRHYIQQIETLNTEGNLVSERSILDAYKILPEFSSSAEEEMLIESKLTPTDVQRLYDEYTEHLFPSFWMTIASFVSFMCKHGFEADQDRLKQYWQAFRFSQVDYMAFEELLIGLVALNRDTPHCVSRLKLIFRFYDQDGDGYLSLSEFHRLVQDTSPQLAHEAIAKKTDTWLRQIKDALDRRQMSQPDAQRPASGRQHRIMQAKITFKTFFKAVKAKIIVGTSRLCLSKVPVHNTIASSLIGRQIQLTFQQNYSFRAVINANDRSRCSSCIDKCQATPYRLANSVIRLGSNRQLTRVRTMNPDASGKSRPRVGHSLEVLFNLHSLPNEYLRIIGHFSRLKYKGTVEDYQGLYAVVPRKLRDQFLVDIEQICKNVAAIVEQEPHIYEGAPSPAIIIGDVHGNIEDLLTLEHHFWSGIPFTMGTYIFLGDYVDRGKWGFECALYLFCLKLLAPQKFILLRGNHEDRYINSTYSYKIELEHKYGPKVGHFFYELTNHVFDRLPVAATLDKAGPFMVHGGIPFSAVGQNLGKLISSLPKVNSEPRHTPLIWEILWSDPSDNLSFRDEYENMVDALNRQEASFPSQATRPDEIIAQQYRLGFLPNRKRGAGHVFNELALGTFLATNGCSHLIRAHEVPQNGYRLQFRTRCLTIFSCSHYCQMSNLSAVLLCADNRYRIVQIDTKNNQPAMFD